MKNAAVGFRVHSGWTALVVLSLEKGVPVVLSRQHLPLVKTFTYKFRQPYHTAEKMRRAEAARFVSEVRAESEELAYSANQTIQSDLQEQGFQLGSGGLLLASGRVLPEFEKILASHALIHTADGELFREVLRSACVRCKIKLQSMKERDLLEHAAKAFSSSGQNLMQQLTQFGKPFGSPWTQDEKLATLAAWLVLAEK